MDIQQLFIAIVEQGSFNKASEKLGITQPTVSKRVDALEERLGTKLFKRSTRQLLLTAAGELYYERAKQICQLVSQTEHDVRNVSGVDDKQIKISATSSVAGIFLPPVLTELSKRHPDAKFRLFISSEYGNYYRQHYELDYDLFLHEGESADANLVYRRLGSIPVGVYAAPNYIKEHGNPQSVEELSQFGRCLGSRILRSHQWNDKLLPGLDTTAFDFVVTSNENISLVEHATAGMGYLFAAEHLVMGALKSGQLAKTGVELPMQPLPFNALYRRDYLSPLARECLDLLQEQVGNRFPVD